MADNRTGTNPIYLDTVGTTSKVTGPVTINAIVFKSTTAGDQCLINDANSYDIIFDATVHTAKETVIFTPARPIVASKGIILTTLTHGSVLIYI